MEIPKFIVDEQALTDLDRQTIELVWDKVELPDGSDQGVSREKARRKKGRTEDRTVIDVYRQINERVVAFHKFDTVEAEQYRKLYIEIVHARRTRELQTLLLTSALAGEGKSISALNLAITSAAAGDQHGVLLVDTDLRKPSIHLSRYTSQVGPERLLDGRHRIFPHLFRNPDSRAHPDCCRRKIAILQLC